MFWVLLSVYVEFLVVSVEIRYLPPQKKILFFLKMAITAKIKAMIVGRDLRRLVQF